MPLYPLLCLFTPLQYLSTPLHCLPMPLPLYTPPLPIYTSPLPLYTPPLPIYAPPMPLYTPPLPIYAPPMPLYTPPQDYSAKLTDFGMVRVGPGGQLRSIVSTRIMGTDGYIDPSYLETGHLGAKSDVYSFGVILLELLTGQRVLEKGNQLVTACRQQFQDLALPSRLYADPKLHGEYPEVGARQLATLAKHCLAEQRHDRPDMVTVLQQLKEIMGRT
ncbi:unnamed protein product [Closterium sp. NIES-65]|nr:unnamed protein product [Closterium sp. NIES-65]